MFDFVVAGGLVADGSGGPPVRADVGIRADKVEAVGDLAAAAAKRRVEATDCWVMPGFVDAHIHCESRLGDEAVQLALLTQGVTTVIVGQDGLSFVGGTSTTNAFIDRYFRAINGDSGPEFVSGLGVSAALASMAQRARTNVATLLPLGTVRANIMGFAKRCGTRSEWALMKDAVAAGLDDGAIGVSTGLDYVPGCFATTEELVYLCRIAKAKGAVYVTHMRGYESRAALGIKEVEDICGRSGVAAHVSHYHGRGDHLCALMHGARERGADITYDTYPYLRSSTTLAKVALPLWVQGGTVEDVVKRLRDKSVVERLDRDWMPTITSELAGVTVSYAGVAAWSWAEGLRFNDLRESIGPGTSPAELICGMLADCDLAVGCVAAHPASNSEADLSALMREPNHMGGSDGIYVGKAPHPRGWGTFARFLSRHTRELGDWSWSDASVHLASAAANRFGLWRRGQVKPGYFADLCVVREGQVADMSTYAEPRRYATGVSQVFVNGVLVLDDGQLVDEYPGIAITN